MAFAMTTASLLDLLADARAGGYALAAINVIDVATMDGVLAAAEASGAPVIVQTAARTARLWGPDVLAGAFRSLAARHAPPSALQLDHCSDRALVTACLEAGWGGVLFDGSALPSGENAAQTRQVVLEAHARGAAVEGELEAIRGHEKGVATGTGTLRSIEQSVDFASSTGIDCFAPAIGNVHGRTAMPPSLDIGRAQAISVATGLPLALHGGTGIDQSTLRALIAAGCAKVNVSTALREACMHAARVRLAGPEDDPTVILEAMRAAAGQAAQEVMNMLSAAGRG